MSNQSLFIRFFLYMATSAMYYLFMHSHAPLGIGWRPFHEQRVFNAVNHILNASPLISYGFTSWDSYQNLVSSEFSGKFYLVSALPHFLHSFLFSIFSFERFSSLAGIGDFLLIAACAVLSAEIFAKIFHFGSLISRLYWPFFVFVLFLSSPWSYRMMLAPWHEVSWLLFVLCSFFCHLTGRHKTAIFLFLFAGLFHWQWSFLYFVYYAIISFACLLTYRSSLQLLFPPSLRSTLGNFCMMSAALAPTVVYSLQRFLLRLHNPNISHSGSSLFFRIGIDTVDNIHHGGWLATLQFLGGNRLSVCLPGGGVPFTSSIGLFNCILSISGWVAVSLLGVAGYVLLCYKLKNLRWLFVPILWSFFLFMLVFQQSFAVHLQGYSFIFSFLFSIGFTFLIRLFVHTLSFSPVTSLLITFPVVTAILISAVRVSYFTNING